MNPRIGRDYTQAIANALTIEQPREAVARVKDVIISEIGAADANAEIHSTQFFNHTFAPDLVLSWSKESSSERYVYLRFNDDLRYMYEGISRMQGREPIVFGLSATPLDNEDRNSLSVEAANSHALVTDPAAIGALVERRTHDPVLVSRDRFSFTLVVWHGRLFP